MGGPKRRNLRVQAITRVRVLDAITTLVSLIIWGLTHTIDVRVYAVMMIARIVADHIYLRHLFEPVRRWQALADRADDASLLAADDALQHAQKRFVRGHALGWLLALLATFSVTFAVPAFAVPVGVAEISTMFFIGVVMVFAPAVFMLALTSSMADALMVEVGASVRARGLSPRRPPASFRSELLVFFTVYAAGSIFGILGFAGKLRVDTIRDGALAEQRARARISAIELRHGIALTDGGVTLVGSDELPAVLELRAGSDEVAVGFDAARGQAIAAAPVDEGRWVIAEAAPEDHVLLYSLLVLIYAVAVVVITGLATHALAHTLLDPSRICARPPGAWSKPGTCAPSVA